MKSITVSTLGCALTLSLLGCASSGGTSNPPPDVDLQGTWVLDRAVSDDLESAIAARGPVATRRPGAVRGGGGGGGGGGGAGGRVVMDRESIYQAMSSLSEAPARLTIEHGDGVVVLRDGSGPTVELPATGAQRRMAWLDGADAQVKAEWRNSSLRIERSRDGVTVVDTYTRAPGSRRLEVVTTVNGGMGGELKLDRAYELESNPSTR